MTHLPTPSEPLHAPGAGLRLDAVGTTTITTTITRGYRVWMAVQA